MSKDTSRGRGIDVSLFEKCQIIGMHQAEITSKDIAGTTKIGLKTVQRIIKNCKDSGVPPCSRKTCGRKKILIDSYPGSLKRLVKSNRRKTTAELRANSESKSMSFFCGNLFWARQCICYTPRRDVSPQLPDLIVS